MLQGATIMVAVVFPPPPHPRTHTRAHFTVSPALSLLQVELCSTSTVTPDTSTRFKIAAKTGRVYELEAANSTDRDAWMETIIVAISHNTVSGYLVRTMGRGGVIVRL